MASGSEPAAPRAAQKIKIVEDNPDAAESLQLLLASSGHAVTVAGSGPAALAAKTPDIIICDIGLPSGMSGYELARAIRARPELRTTFLVALTGYGQQADQRAALVSGFDVHLTKPVDPNKLEPLLQPARREK